MFSDWIIIGALIVLAAVVVLYFRSGVIETPVSSGRSGSPTDRQAKNATTGN